LPEPDPPKKKSPVTYADAGVDLSSGDRTKQRIKYLAQRTFTKDVLSEIGGFGGLFKLDTAKYKQPVALLSRLPGDGRARRRGS
jgi:phosphoribosylformylglycinamidine cyclo-ligase